MSLTEDTGASSSQEKKKMKLEIPNTEELKTQSFPFLHGFVSCVHDNNGIISNSLLQGYWNKCKKDIRETPGTPVKVSMIFNKEELLEAIFLNLCLRKTALEDKTLKQLITFSRNRFLTLSSKVSLQILLHFSKADLTDDKFNEMLHNFLYVQNEMKDAEYINQDNVLKENIVCYLQKPLMLKAISKTLELILNNEVDNTTLIRLIKSMNVYSAEVFFPLSIPLRGAALQDGIVIFKNRMATHWKAKELLTLVDTLTLALHESTHFIARSVLKNFNFSSPFKTGENLKPVVRYDTTDKPLELGRAAEIQMFGFQPQWLGSSDEVASSFLDKLNSNEDKLPIFGKTKPEGLLERTVNEISIGFAMDILDAINLC